MIDGSKGEPKIADERHDEEAVPSQFWKVCDAGLPAETSRLHTHIEGRYITVFRQKGKLSAIDSVCYHAGGPLTLGTLQDIEDLDGITAVSCPSHKFLVSIEDGSRVYQQVTIVNGKPSVKGWTKGKVVQRAHQIFEDETGVYVALQITDDTVESDKDAKNTHCVRDYIMHTETAIRKSRLSTKLLGLFEIVNSAKR